MGETMPTGELKVGSMVRVSSKAPRYGGRTGVILEQRNPHGGEGERNWRVRFDWPLGGVGSYAIVAADDLELQQNMPGIREERL